MSAKRKRGGHAAANPDVEMQPVDKSWDDAVDWLINSRHCADPIIQKAFWGIVEGKYTRDEADAL